MQKGYKREGRGMAVLRCFIGLFVMIVVILLAYFMLRLDYSDKLDPNASIRPYVEITPSPSPSATPVVTEAPVIVQATEVPVVTEAPQVTAVPTAEPTEAPTPEPTAEPTPVVTATPAPTKIPSSAVSPLKFSGYKLPSLSGKSAKLGITHSYRSSADNNRYLYLEGYAYIDDGSYNGANADIYLVVIRSTGHTALALPTKVKGISGSSHSSAKCSNASSSDFKVVLDVGQFPDDTYTLGMVFTYKDAGNGKNRIEYVTFPKSASFSVQNKKVSSGVKTVTAE